MTTESRSSSDIAITNKLGDFTGLASNYSLYRPSYSKTVLRLILALTERPIHEISAVDLGAGTGIWTRLLHQQSLGRVVAVEPNEDMRTNGQKDSTSLSIEWIDGSGENSGLPSESFDLVTAASCFHWFDFEAGMREIRRLLKPGGVFVALWNPRYLVDNPILVDFENKLKELAPNIERKSSGSSRFVERLTERFSNLEGFEDVVYLEARHQQKFTPDQYLGVWKSVNDIQVQAGPKKFSAFLDYIEAKLNGQLSVDCTYLTRAWSVRRVKDS